MRQLRATLRGAARSVRSHVSAARMNMRRSRVRPSAGARRRQCHAHGQVAHSFEQDDVSGYSSDQDDGYVYHQLRPFRVLTLPSEVPSGCSGRSVCERSVSPHRYDGHPLLAL